MPLFLAISTKTALTFGAVLGGTVAVVANKDKLMEITADALQRGADFLHHQIEKKKVRMACDVRTGEYARYVDGDESEATTPGALDDEWEDDEKDDKDAPFMRHDGSTSTLVLRHDRLEIDSVD